MPQTKPASKPQKIGSHATKFQLSWHKQNLAFMPKTKFWLSCHKQNFGSHATKPDFHANFFFWLSCYKPKIGFHATKFGFHAISKFGFYATKSGFHADGLGFR